MDRHRARTDLGLGFGFARPAELGAVIATAGHHLLAAVADGRVRPLSDMTLSFDTAAEAAERRPLPSGPRLSCSWWRTAVQGGFEEKQGRTHNSGHPWRRDPPVRARGCPNTVPVSLLSA